MPGIGSCPKSLVRHALSAEGHRAARPLASMGVDASRCHRSNRLDGQELAGVNVD
jgi:hypothetical protein